MGGRRLPVPVLPLWLRLSFVVAIAGVIFYYSIWTVPPPEPASPGGITVPSPTPEDDRTPDWFELIEWRHVLAYMALGVSLAYALVTEARPLLEKALLVVVVAFAYGLAIEVGQEVLTTRRFTVRDLGLNAIGIAASLSWFALERYGRPVDLNRLVRRRLRARRRA